jgi:hypothetical protein
MLAKLLAGILGLMAFAICILGGLSSGARAEVAITRGLKAMIVFCLLGWVVGWAAETVVFERVRKEAQDALDRAEPSESESEAESEAEPAGSHNGQATTSKT